MFLPLKSFIVVAFVATQVQMSPVDVQSLLDEAGKAENYDVIIDQRQNGPNNFRVKYAILSKDVSSS